MPSNEDTIAAIATPIGPAGIGIIRISGRLSSGIAKDIFTPKKPVRCLDSHRLYLGDLFDPASGEVVDEVLLSFMKAPHSFTREDIVEINSHSGYLLLYRILQIIISQGARLAEPGEFTLRAFLNGRIDLTRAEAVIDLINAKSDRGLRMASQQVHGLLWNEIDALRQIALGILAHGEVAIDFPEEEADIMTRDEVGDRIEARLVGPIEILIEAHAGRKIWIDGINTAIVGRVNAGKSSLLNRLLNEDRAIVTAIPGTTRDVIESTATIEGLPLRLMDTAGFREVKDEVERIGIQFTEKKLSEADFLLVVVDQSRPLNQDDRDILAQSRKKNALIVMNKIDLPSAFGKQFEDRALSGLPSVKISALTGEGLPELKKGIAACLLNGELDMTTSHSAPNLRHRGALESAAGFFRNAARNVRENAPMEVVAVDLKSGIDALGEIVGETASEAVLENIFSQFCLGK